MRARTVSLTQRVNDMSRRKTRRGVDYGAVLFLFHGVGAAGAMLRLKGLGWGSKRIAVELGCARNKVPTG